MNSLTTFQVHEVNEISNDENEKKQINIYDRFTKFLKKNANIFYFVFNSLIHIGIGGYFAYATYYFIEIKSSNDTRKLSNDDQNSCEPGKSCPFNNSLDWCSGFGMLILLFSIFYIVIIYNKIIYKYFGKPIDGFFELLSSTISRLLQYRFSKASCFCIFLVGFIAYIIYDTSDARYRLQSAWGILAMLTIGFIFSKYRSNIKLQPVVCGLCLQILCGIFCIRWDVGRSIFKCFGDKIKTFLDYTDNGSEFAYGNLIINVESVFAFRALSTIYFFGFFISILYYWGIIQWILQKFGKVLQTLLGTTVCESIICTGNIFLGMTESVLTIQPYLKYLTHSEMHTLMASGFSTVAGTVLGVYVAFGADPANLITSTVMAAPGAICFSKLFYPETEKSQTSSDNFVLEKSTSSSFLSAATSGALSSIAIIHGAIANIIAFLAFIAFLNGLLSWFGSHVGLDELSLQVIFGQVCIPVAWVIGIPWKDCGHVANLIATKSMINEFVAYQKLGVLKKNGDISLRSTAIATYAICGFANPCSVGILIGMISSLAPNKQETTSNVAIRAYISGCIVCLITASIAGLLLTDVPDVYYNDNNNNHTITEVML